MVEAEALINIRRTIAENVVSVERPDSLQAELLDELCAVDRQLGGLALFTMSRDQYQIPNSYANYQSDEPLLNQEAVLF